MALPPPGRQEQTESRKKKRQQAGATDLVRTRLVLKDRLQEELLQLLVGEIDAELLETVDGKKFKAVDIKEPDVPRRFVLGVTLRRIRRMSSRLCRAWQAMRASRPP